MLVEGRSVRSEHKYKNANNVKALGSNQNGNVWYQREAVWYQTVARHRPPTMSASPFPGQGGIVTATICSAPFPSLRN